MTADKSEDDWTDLSPFLILHKVRGEPAFDIAHRLSIGGEPAWLVTTSGHRAYPVRHWLLADLADISDINSTGYHQRPIIFDHVVFPPNWPDHYATDKATLPLAVRSVIADLQMIGLVLEDWSEEKTP